MRNVKYIFTIWSTNSSESESDESSLKVELLESVSTSYSISKVSSIAKIFSSPFSADKNSSLVSFTNAVS